MSIRQHLAERRPGNTKLTTDDVLEIKRRIARPEPDARIARDYGVAAETIGKIRRGWAWSHVRLEEG